MITGTQLNLDFQKHARFSVNDFIVSDCNSQAFEVVSSWPGWHFRNLSIYGSKGCGKSHLAHIWAAKSDAIILNENEFNNFSPIDIIETSRNIVLEFGSLNFDENSLFHLINLVSQKEGFLLITTEEPPGRWDVSLQDLRSRLRGFVAVEITEVDDELIFSLAVKEFANRDIKLKIEVISYLISHLPERTFNTLHCIIDTLDTKSLSQHREISIPFVREVLNTEYSANRELNTC